MEKHIILLHGALGSKSQFDELKNGLTHYSHVHTFNFIGHGGVEIPQHLSMPDLVDQLENYIQQYIPKESSLVLFGYSMGGYAALLLAAKDRFNIDKVITLGTKLIWDHEIATGEIKMLNPTLIEEKLPDFARELQQRHAPEDWKLLLSKTAEMMIDLGMNQYLSDEVLSNISVPVKLMIGEKDKMVSLEETVEVYKKIKGASLSVLPLTPHPIDRVNVDELIFEITSS